MRFNARQSLANPDSPARRTASWAYAHRKWAVGLLVVGAVVILAAGPLTLAFPQACNPCHAKTGEYAQWAESPHATVSCASCHTDRGLLFGLGNSLKLVGEVSAIVRGERVRNVAWISDDGCLLCHKDYETLITMSGGLRMSHVGLAEAGFRCAECHAEVAHRSPDAKMAGYKMSTCATCHNNVNVSGQCDTCHTGKTDSSEARTLDPEWAATHGPNWQQMHGMGDLSTCVLCHDPRKCEGCHGVGLPHNQAFAAEHGAQAIADRTACGPCHTTSYCESCHGIDMPHPDGFLPEHSSIAVGFEDPACARCHTTTNCNECHERHAHPGKPQPLRPPGARDRQGPQ